MRPVDEIIVHCTATPEGRPHTVKDIDDWHRARLWSGIGYHRVIGLDGERWAGRALDRIGAHVAGHNQRTIGVVYVGGVAKDGVTAKDTRTSAQKLALKAELIELRDRFGIRKITGHQDYAAKACPSFDATAEFSDLATGTAPIISKPDEILTRGDVGTAVANWRGQLAAWRRRIGHPWPIQPGTVFDHTVEIVTIEFQTARGILADGSVGPQTRDEMNRALHDLPPFQAQPRTGDDELFAALRFKLEEVFALLPNR